MSEAMIQSLGEASAKIVMLEKQLAEAQAENARLEADNHALCKNVKAHKAYIKELKTKLRTDEIICNQCKGKAGVR